MAEKKEAGEKKDYQFGWDGKEVKHRWECFVKFGNATATEMTGKNFDKWLKDAGVIDSKTITTTMTGIAFSKVTGPKKKANFAETKQVLVAVAEDRARTSKKSVQEELDAITEKLAKLEAPSVKGVAKASADGVYSRLTDHTKYTGAHKERFDAEGKGKGKAGREDLKDDTGYVAAYKNKDTYDKTHGKQ
ncbi:TPPP family protein C32E8.3 [Toxocara canis]|uniref:TPPP family protein C32E8.3 n=1 Tax=Toxocara canis TaxID=6265 RepID=A0A0B2VS39_TOXCA|nr:TPPP family protein C32E8.3 [Toxocara canis]